MKEGNRIPDLLCSAIFIFVSFVSLGQKQNNIWYFGHHAGLDFKTEIPTVITNSDFSSGRASAVLCDRVGNLLFYTDGDTVWNRLHIPMEHGHGLLGNQHSQQVLIVPLPGSDSIYYIFTASPDYDYNFPGKSDTIGFFYSVVSLNRSGGLGDVTAKNIFLFRKTTEKIAAIYHADGKNIWVVAHEWQSNAFRSYLLNEDGIDTTRYTKSLEGANPPPAQLNGNTGGQMKISPDGKKLALAIEYGNQIFDFDSATGKVSNAITLGENNCLSDPTTEGVEFSPNSQFLYYNRRMHCPNDQMLRIYQYTIKDNTTTEIYNTFGYDSGFFEDAIQLAPDGKIYFANNFKSNLAVIEKPNIAGASCHFIPNYINLYPQYAEGGLPTFFQSYFIFPDPVLEMPNVFTPNSDSFNQRFIPLHFANINQARLKIIDRWGAEIFSTDDLETGWDGGNSAAGIYYWLVTYYGTNGTPERKKGWVQLAR